jgi:hypothetical protein
MTSHPKRHYEATVGAALCRNDIRGHRRIEQALLTLLPERVTCRQCLICLSTARDTRQEPSA